MLSTNIFSTSSPESKQPEKSLLLTIEDTENFYRIITHASYNKLYPLHDAAGLLRKNLAEYFKSILLKSSIDPSSLKIKKQIILTQLKIIKENNFFQEPLETKRLELITQEIANDGFKKLIPAEDREEFISTLHNINDELQNSFPQPNTIPSDIKSGISSTEQESITYGNHYFQSLPGFDLYQRGISCLNNQEWSESIKFFEAAINAEKEMASELKQPADYSNISIYQRNIAEAFNMGGINFLDEKNHQGAIENFQNEMLALNKIPESFKNKTDGLLYANSQRLLAKSYDLLAIDYYFEDKLYDSIENHKKAVNCFKQIPTGLIEETDKRILIKYQRNLALVLDRLGGYFQKEKKLEEAIEQYQLALNVAKEISADERTIDDEALLDYLQKTLDFAIYEYETPSPTTPLANNPSGFFTPRTNSEPTVEMEDKETPHKKNGG